MHRGMRWLAMGLLGLSTAACGDDDPPPSDGSDGTSTDTSTSTTGDSGLVDSTTDIVDGSTTDTGEPEIPWDGEWPLLECDSLVPEYCAFPYPNNVFTVADPATPSGRRVQLSEAMVPVASNGGTTTLDIFNTRDGFSPGIALMAFLPGATLEGVAGIDDIDRSLDEESPTVLIDTETGQRVPHWAGLDMTTDDDDRRTFLIQPATRLEDERRYIVAIRNVVDGSGVPLLASPAFAALRDGTDIDDDSVESRRGLYTDIFDRLEEAGVARDELQLAWDFTTATMQDNTEWLVGMRDEALDMVGPGGPSYTLTTINTDWNADVAVRMVGTMEVPLYLDQPGVGGVINLDATGQRPEQNGTAEYPFEVLVPYSAMDEPAALLQFGHGLFGSYASVEGLGAFANSHNLVIFALDWIGMSEADALPIGGLLSSGDLAAFETLPSRLLQSHVNALLAMRMMMGDFVDDPNIQFMGGSAINPDERYYFGASLGGIMGSVYMALTPDVQRGGLGVPGQSFNVLLPRSVLFDPFFDILRMGYEDPRDIQILLSAAMLVWDRAEPTGYSRYIREDALGTDPHEVLLQVAIGDHQVSNHGSHIMARTIGVPLLTPAPRSVWGLQEVKSGHVGSAMIEHDFGLPAIPTSNTPMRDGSDPHAAIWSYDVGIDELEHFLRTGEVVSFCDGPCDPD